MARRAKKTETAGTKCFERVNRCVNCRRGPWTSGAMHSDQQALGGGMEIDTQPSSVGQLEAPLKTFGERRGQHDPCDTERKNMERLRERERGGEAGTGGGCRCSQKR